MNYFRKILLRISKGVPVEDYKQCVYDRDNFEKNHKEDHIVNHGCKPGEMFKNIDINNLKFKRHF